MLKAGYAGRMLAELFVLPAWMDLLYHLSTISSLCRWQTRQAYCTFWWRRLWAEGWLNSPQMLQRIQVLPEKYFFLQRFSGRISTSATVLECFSCQHKVVTHYIWLVSSNQQIKATTNSHPGFSFTGFAQCLWKFEKTCVCLFVG